MVCRFSVAYYISMLCCVLILGIEVKQRLDTERVEQIPSVLVMFCCRPSAAIMSFIFSVIQHETCFAIPSLVGCYLKKYVQLGHNFKVIIVILSYECRIYENYHNVC